MSLVKEMPKEERPREKAMMFGVKTLSNSELLALLIRTGYAGYSSIHIAEILLKKANGLIGLARLSEYDLLKIKGIKKVKALEILACIELSRRLTYHETLNKDVVSSPDDLIKWLKTEIGSENQEHFMVVYLNIKNHIIGYKILFKGTVDCSLVHPREVFKEAVMLSASKLMLVHNHPSSDFEPSLADIELTNQLSECAQMMGLVVLDHLIVTQYNFFSFKSKGLL